MRELIIKFLYQHLYSLGMFTEKKQTLSSLKLKCGLLNMYDRWLQESIRILKQENYIYCYEKEIYVTNDIQLNIEDLWDCLLYTSPSPRD